MQYHNSMYINIYTHIYIYIHIYISYETWNEMKMIHICGLES